MSIRGCVPFDALEGHAVIHRGIQYTVVATAEPDIWEWRYEYAGQVKTGRTQTRLAALAGRRVKSKIDAALRAARPASSQSERSDLQDTAAHPLT